MIFISFKHFDFNFVPDDMERIKLQDKDILYWQVSH